MLKMQKKAAFLAAFFILIGCNSVERRSQLALDLAVENDFLPIIEKSDLFPIQTFVKKFNTSHAVIYVEGDGLVLTSSGIAFDPTPTDPMALRLAIVDNRNFTKIVVNRPCQYVTCRSCSNKYWTNARYSQEVIDSIVQVIKKMQEQYNFKTFDVIAYSGGAAVSFLIAPYFLKEIQSIYTFAGNVDYIEWVKYHEFSPLNQSLDPLKNSHILRKIKQKHFCGLKDENTTINITKNFKKN